MGNGTYWDSESGSWSTVQVDSPFDKAKVFVRTTAPVTDVMRTGDLYINATTNKVMYRNGSSWVSLGALSVIADVTGLQAALDSKAPLSVVAALDLKAPLASPTFTGTVSGVTKAMVGLGNVDNTSDVNKPVSIAQQTALNLKANIANVMDLTSDQVIGGTKAFTDISLPAAAISTESVSGLDAALAGKASTGHTHVAANITDLFTQVNYMTKTAGAVSGTDLNTLKTPGSYFYTDTCTNGPYASSYGFMEVFSGPTDIFQRVTMATNTIGEQWVRRFWSVDSSWSTWQHS